MVDPCLDFILKRNYNHFRDSDIGDIVYEFIEKHSTMADMSILRIKRLTKIGLRLVRERTTDSREMIRRLFDFTLEGLIRTSLKETVSVSGLGGMEAHLCTYAADFAQLQFKHTGEPLWLEEALELYAKSNELEESRIKDSLQRNERIGGNLAAMGGIARKLFEVTSQREHIELAYDLRKQAAARFKEARPVRWAEQRAIAAGYAEELYKQTNDMFWAEDAYNLRMEAVETFRAFDKEEALRNLKKLAIFCRKMNTVTKSEEFLIRSYDANLRLAEMGDLEAITFAARDAEQLYRNTNQVKWLIEEQQIRRKAGQLMVEKDMAEARLQYMVASKKSARLFEITRDLRWKKEQVECEFSYVEMGGNIRAYLKVADIAEHLFYETREERWMEKALLAKKRFIENTQKQEAAAFASIDAAILARKAYNEIKDPRWGEKAYEMNMKAASLKRNRFEVAQCYKFAAMDAEEMYYLTKDIRWMEKEYQARKSAAGFFSDSHEAKNQYMIAAKVATRLFEKTKSEIWLEQAYHCNRMIGDIWKPSSASSVASFHAAENALMLLDITRNEMWAEKAESSLEQSEKECRDSYRLKRIQRRKSDLSYLRKNL